MKIASWNVNGIRARIEHVTAWIKSNQPDVLALQETKVMDVPADYNAAFTDLITKISDLEDSTSWKE